MNNFTTRTAGNSRQRAEKFNSTTEDNTRRDGVLNPGSLEGRCVIKHDEDVARGRGRSLRRSRECTCTKHTHLAVCSSTSVSDSRENSRTVIALTSGGVATMSRTRSDIAIEEIIRYLCLWIRRRCYTTPLSQKRIFQRLIILQMSRHCLKYDFICTSFRKRKQSRNGWLFFKGILLLST